MPVDLSGPHVLLCYLWSRGFLPAGSAAWHTPGGSFASPYPSPTPRPGGLQSCPALLCAHSPGHRRLLHLQPGLHEAWLIGRLPQDNPHHQSAELQVTSWPRSMRNSSRQKLLGSGAICMQLRLRVRIHLVMTYSPFRSRLALVLLSCQHFSLRLCPQLPCSPSEGEDSLQPHLALVLGGVWCCWWLHECTKPAGARGSWVGGARLWSHLGSDVHSALRCMTVDKSLIPPEPQVSRVNMGVTTPGFKGRCCVQKARLRARHTAGS